MPMWLAPNLITIIGLAINVFTSLVHLYFCPTATEEVRIIYSDISHLLKVLFSLNYKSLYSCLFFKNVSLLTFNHVYL